MAPRRRPPHEPSSRRTSSSPRFMASRSRTLRRPGHCAANRPRSIHRRASRRRASRTPNRCSSVSRLGAIGSRSMRSSARRRAQRPSHPAHARRFRALLGFRAGLGRSFERLRIRPIAYSQRFYARCPCLRKAGRVITFAQTLLRASISGHRMADPQPGDGRGIEQARAGNHTGHHEADSRPPLGSGRLRPQPRKGIACSAWAGARSGSERWICRWRRWRCW